MTLHACQCGQPIDVSIEPNIVDFDYAVEFTRLDAATDDAPITHCPACKSDLYDQFKTGALHEQAPTIEG